MHPSRNHQLRPLVLHRFWHRARGLLFREELLDQEGVLIKPCRAIHTLGMTREIDVIFLDIESRVTEVFRAVKPHRVIASKFADAFSTLEIASGEAQKFGIEAGDRIVFLERIGK